MIPKTGVVLRRRPKCFQQPTTAARVERDYPRISQIGSDCSQQAGMGRKKKQKSGKLACRVSVFALPHSRLPEVERVFPIAGVASIPTPEG